MPLFRKKPVMIEARRWEPDNVERAGDVTEWLTAHQADFALDEAAGTQPALLLRTLEGEMRADPGDWIIRGVAGELYPCKPDIFDATYEPVEED